MNLSDLLQKGVIKKINPDSKQAQELLAAAERDIRVAKKMLDADYDWAFSVAYNAMLQSARALMFSEGFVAVGEEHHKAAVGYADVKLGTKYAEIVNMFDDMRKKRHRVIYEKVGVVSEYEAKHAIKTAEAFLEKIKERLE